MSHMDDADYQERVKMWHTFTRCGMGPCQGRLCGPTVTELIATERGVPVADVGYYRLRPPVKPVTLGELAGTAPTSDTQARLSHQGQVRHGGYRPTG